MQPINHRVFSFASLGTLAGLGLAKASGQAIAPVKPELPEMPPFVVSTGDSGLQLLDFQDAYGNTLAFTPYLSWRKSGLPPSDLTFLGPERGTDHQINGNNILDSVR